MCKKTSKKPLSKSEANLNYYTAPNAIYFIKYISKRASSSETYFFVESILKCTYVPKSIICFFWGSNYLNLLINGC